jgi:hypothetical protein
LATVLSIPLLDTGTPTLDIGDGTLFVGRLLLILKFLLRYFRI